MKFGSVRLIGAARVASAIGAIGAALTAAPLAAHHVERRAPSLEAACTAASGLETADLCPCTIAGARAAGVLDTELAAIFADETAVSQAATGPQRVQYNRYRRAKIRCTRDAAMAQMGGGEDAPQTGQQPGGSYVARPIRPQPRGEEN